MDFRRPFGTDLVLDGEPDAVCLANFRLSRGDERHRQNHFAMDDWGIWRLNFSESNYFAPRFGFTFGAMAL